MENCLGHLPAGTPVCSIGMHPTRPGRWVLSRCEAGALPIILELPATQQVPQFLRYLFCNQDHRYNSYHIHLQLITESRAHAYMGIPFMCSTESCCYKLHCKHTLPRAGQLQHLQINSVSNFTYKAEGFLSTHGDIKSVQIKYQFDTSIVKRASSKPAWQQY